MAKISEDPRLNAAMCALVTAAGLSPSDVASVSIDYRAETDLRKRPGTIVRVELYMTTDMLSAFTTAAAGTGQDEEG